MADKVVKIPGPDHPISIAPDLKRVLIVGEATHPLWPAYVRAAETAAAVVGMQIGQGPARDAGDVSRVLEAAGREEKTGLMVVPGLVTAGAKQLVVKLAAERQMPAIYAYKLFVEAGGMMYLIRLMLSMGPGGARPTSIVFCAAKSPLTYQCSCRPSLNW